MASSQSQQLSSYTSVSLDVLREQGPMTLRELTGATAKRMGWSLMYADVDAVMRRHAEDGDATCSSGADYRDSVWTAATTGERPS